MTLKKIDKQAMKREYDGWALESPDRKLLSRTFVTRERARESKRGYISNISMNKWTVRKVTIIVED
jgi:hypothetical protein